MSFYLASEDGSDPQRFRRNFKVGAALIGGACLVFLSMVGISALIPGLHSGDRSIDLVGMPTSLRTSSKTPMLYHTQNMKPWVDLALASVQYNSCDRDVAMKANPAITAALGKMSRSDIDVLAAARKRVVAKAKAVSKAKAATESLYGLPGAIAPVQGIWDPFSLSKDASEGQILYFREAELKHGRVCMLASLGFLVQEQFHPFFGGDTFPEMPAIQSFSKPEILPFWAALIVGTGALEFLSFDRFENSPEQGLTPWLKAGESPGAIGFDPLGLKPDDPEELEAMQNREILHGRLSMIAAAGFIAQELLTQSKLFEGGIYGVQ